MRSSLSSRLILLCLVAAGGAACGDGVRPADEPLAPIRTPLPVANEGEGEGEGEPGCSNADLAIADDAGRKKLLVTFPYAVDDSVPPQLGVFSLDDGAITSAGPLLPLSFEPGRVEFLPSGELALVVGERGELATIRVAHDGLTLLHQLEAMPFPVDPALVGQRLPGSGYGELAITTVVEARGLVAYATNFDSSAEAGVSRVIIACDGTITLDAAAHFPARLASSLALLPNGRGLLLGGAATFTEPPLLNELHILNLGATTTTALGSFDLVDDTLSSTRIGAAVDGSFALLPNNALFSADAGTVLMVDISAAGVVSERGRLTGFGAPSEAVVAPDGTVAAVSDWDANAVALIDVSGPDAPRLITKLTGLGLAEQMAMIPTGRYAGRVFVPEVRASGGSFITAIDLGNDAGTRGASYALTGEGIPVGIAVQR